MRAIVADRRLEAIAGPPLAERTTVGTTTGILLDPMEDRTLYSVIEITGTASSYPTYALSGTFTTGGLSTRSGGSGTLLIGARFDMDGGSSNQIRYVADGRTTGRHIVWAQVSSGMSVMLSGIDLKVSNPGKLEPGNGIAQATLQIYSSNDVVTYASLYRGAHDEATRRRVLSWLAQRYQILM